MAKIKQKQMQRRSEIIETVIPLLEKTSFEDLSMADICQAAGISVGSFYHYFHAKSDILVGLLALIDEYMETEVFPLLKEQNEIENLKLFAHHWAVYVDEHGLERSKLISSVIPSDEDLSGHKRVSLRRLEQIIMDGQEKKQIRGDIPAEELTDLFFLAMRGVTVDWSRTDGRYSVVSKLDRYIGLFVQALCV